ncbi:Lrp/AsnC family transcriptional regulator [Jannaschia sp. M317]|uniref:Lrp/AsnC family transcriptional regulator n=1 Tax=Jannaschia sp. M317 TaxID=2867011 RepID=UPI0021A952F7|nr:Lrp/AsnC family transcriptional regulator [Jannaschia sp. M317]UWQ18601.1 Lrp/AsnC family transcriptional regulator [Jannaschia sp. M317]
MQDYDETDRRLLRFVQRDASLSAAQLSERVNLSPSACHRRLQRLQTAGVITGHVALLDPRRVGRPTTVFVEISLSTQADEVLDAFEAAVARIPDVLECHLMTGAYDYLLKVVARDSEDFAQIHRRHLARLPGVSKMQSSFALKTVCKTTALPV